MKPLLSATSLRALDDLCGARTLFAFDFDGTLAPIVARRAAAAMPATTLRLLRQLGVLAPVAVVSGRRLKDLRARLAPRPAYLIGNHGIENPVATRAALRDAQRLSTTWATALSVKSDRELRNVDIENKRYSLALHYRTAPDPARARRAVLRAIRALTPAPRIVPGKRVINLLPPDAPDKGRALQQLLRATQFQHMLFIGDDVTDEDVFALRDRRIVSVRVGKSVASRARYYLRAQPEIDVVLRHLVDRLRRNASTQKQ